MKDVYRIGTRGSRLALEQTRQAAALLEKAHPGARFQIETIRTAGDRDQVRALGALGIEGIFTKELDNALLEGRIDLAVHSLKDVPTRLAEGITLAAVPQREEANDILFSADGGPLTAFPSGAAVGTGSLRRRAQLLHLRPDLATAPLRGNIDTRLRKLHEDNEYAGVLLALAGVRRLALPLDNGHLLPLGDWLPAPAQGALGVTTRAEDEETTGMAAAIEAPATRACVAAERALLAHLGGGCRVPIGAYATLDRGMLRLQAFVSDVDGRTFLRDEASAPAAQGAEAAATLARRLLDSGGEALLAEFR